MFDAFRQKDFMIGAYFSKPDWHCNDYWSRDRATPTRNVNYDIKLNPDKWKRFQEYTANQINELMTRYGRVDLLWLDGGWVRAPKEDIKMDQIIDKAREYQPGLIAVDRTVPGRNENYQTPELTIPKRQLDHPWESCITLTNHWGWWKDAPYKSAAQVINILTEIVAKGGSLVLGVGPTPEGTIEEEGIQRLKEIGQWLKIMVKQFTTHALLLSIKVRISGSRLTKMERRCMLSMHCRTMWNCRRKLYGKEMNLPARWYCFKTVVA